MRLGSYHEPHLLPVNLASVQAAAELRARVEPSSHALRFFCKFGTGAGSRIFRGDNDVRVCKAVFSFSTIFFALESY